MQRLLSQSLGNCSKIHQQQGHPKLCKKSLKKSTQNVVSQSRNWLGLISSWSGLLTFFSVKVLQSIRRHHPTKSTWKVALQQHQSVGVWCGTWWGKGWKIRQIKFPNKNSAACCCFSFRRRKYRVRSSFLTLFIAMKKSHYRRYYTAFQELARLSLATSPISVSTFVLINGFCPKRTHFHLVE